MKRFLAKHQRRRTHTPIRRFKHMHLRLGDAIANLFFFSLSNLFASLNEVLRGLNDRRKTSIAVKIEKFYPLVVNRVKKS